MTISELAVSYRKSASAVKERRLELMIKLESETDTMDDRERRSLNVRINELKAMERETVLVALYLEHKYLGVPLKRHKKNLADFKKKRGIYFDNPEFSHLGYWGKEGRIEKPKEWYEDDD